MKITTHLHICSNMVAEPRCSATSQRMPLDGGLPAGSAAGRMVTSVEQEANQQQAASASEFVIKVEDELQKFRDGILALMDKNLVSPAGTGESKMSYYAMVGDYCQHLAELAAVEAKSKAAEDDCVADTEAAKITEESIDEDVLVVLRRQVPVIQQVQKTVEIPQVQHTGQIIDVSVTTQRGVPTTRTVQKTVDVPQVQFPDRVADVPVVMQRHAPRTVEEIIDVLVSRATEKIIDVVKHIPQGRLVEETGVPVPRAKEEILEAVERTPQEHVQNCTGEQLIDVPGALQQNRTLHVIKMDLVKKFLEILAEIEFAVGLEEQSDFTAASLLSGFTTRFLDDCTVQPGVREQRSQLHRLFRERQR